MRFDDAVLTGTRYHFADHLGTPRVITDAAGNVLSRHDYYPYGKEITPWADGETHKFTGQERDAESGLDYFVARHYSSNLGRFMQPDEFTGGPVLAWSANDPAPPGPLPYADIANPQSLNKYAYTYNNPVQYTDPDGHCVFAGIDTLACAAAAVTITAAATALILSTPAGQKAIQALGDVLNAAAENARQEMTNSFRKVEPYEVGTYGDLAGRSKGDEIDAHKVPQAGPASQTIPGYDRKTAPAIALPADEHKKIPTERGEAGRNPRDQTAKDVKDLRKKTNAPRPQIQKLIKKIKETYPEAMSKPQKK